ncbi:TetR/AcrR family transcriptional regulator [Xenorhabdus kozodoii]|uniref:TetR family transcriptional regulator n=1 Tax=Xenorhabdus kozodoii TaxID=351676 RepID=A0A2D0L3N4_9GAMM|nr:TetR/AcrR family transcriptional regulator [Xenorhabdus kozodoii]PHM70007.1 TetR family transcriptional regulator [Xenorhabdus kozodoii]
MRGRPKEYDSVDVLDSAMDVFWTHGYEASSTKKLCEKTGIGSGSLYHAFGSKQKLYEQVLRRYHELGFEIQKSILNDIGSVKERLKAFLLWGITADLESDTHRGCMALHSVFERNNKDPVVEHINRHYVTKIEVALSQLIKEGMDNNEISKKRSVIEVTRAFLASYYGLLILRQSMPEKEYLNDVIEGIVSGL